MEATWPILRIDHLLKIASTIGGKLYKWGMGAGRKGLEQKLIFKFISRQLESLLPMIWVYTRICIWLDFAHAYGGQCSCACNLVREQVRKKFEKYIVQGALAQAKSGHSCII